MLRPARECCHTLLGQKKISPNPPLISRYPSLPSKPRQNDCRNMKGLVGFGTWNGIYFSLYVSTVGGICREERKEKLQYFSFLSQLYDVTRNAKWYGGHFSSLLLTWFENLRLAVTDLASIASNSCHYLYCWEMITHIFKQFLTSLICYWFNFVLNNFYLQPKRVEHGFEQQQSDIRLHHSAALLQCAALGQQFLNILRFQSTFYTHCGKNSILKFTRPSFVNWWFLPELEQLYKVLPLAQLYTTTRQATPWDGSCCQATRAGENSWQEFSYFHLSKKLFRKS